MSCEVSCHFEVVTESGFAQHFVGVSTYRNRNASLEIMMVVQSESMGEFGDRSIVVSNMTKVFADILKVGFECSHGHGVEINHTCFALDIFIVQGDGCF